MSRMIIDPDDVTMAITSLRPMSAGSGRLLALMAEAERATSDVVQVIETDPALTANVLRTVNSAAMGLRREITTIQEAVAYLGDTRIVGIALASAASDVFGAELNGYHGQRGDLGRHCLWSAIAARELAPHTGGVVDPGTAFTAGLLHDIGKAVISDFLADATADAPLVAEGDHLDLEQDTMGTDHCTVGAAIARHWRLPATLVHAIAHHHRPADAPADQRALAYTVHLADTLAMMFGRSTGVDALQYELDPGYSDHVELDQGGLEALALDVHLDFRATADAIFGKETTS